MKTITSIFIGFIIATFIFGNTPWNRQAICEKLDYPLNCIEKLK